MSRRAVFAVLLLLAPSLGGCYLLKQAQGQIHILMNSRDLDEVLGDPDLPQEKKAKLLLIRDVKAFGEREMAITPSTNYETFYDTKGRPITYLVSACAKDRFEPYTWWFPIVGTVPYKGFFSKEDAADEAKALEEQGYDVTLGSASAYSTLGWFSDPILSGMLEYPDEELVSLILHELTHGTIYLPGGTDFNEGLASFVGWQGALEYARKRHGIDSDPYDRTVRAFADEEKRDGRARELFRKLNELYKSDLPREEKLKRRDEIAGRPVNNAAILMQRRYGRYDQFRERYESVGGDWKRFFDSLRKDSRGPSHFE